MNRLLVPGEPAPWFRARALDGIPDYAFDQAAGRWVLMLFAGEAARDEARAALALLARNRELFDDVSACFYGVSIAPSDVTQGLIARSLPGIRWFLDHDRAVSERFGALQSVDGEHRYAPHWLLLDPLLRAHALAPLAEGAKIFALLRGALAGGEGEGGGAGAAVELPAPVLMVPGILSPAHCRELIALYERHGGRPSGFMRDQAGQTAEVMDRHVKRRADHAIIDEAMIAALKSRLALTLRPMIHRAFQFEANRIERFLVACYDASDHGYFRAHRDNTTRGTEHRRFACTINLNAEDYEGGDLVFPEFGPRAYRVPTGGAAVFSCSLLHEARPVTRGRRYAFLPFFYDDAAARQREDNLAHVAPELRHYRSGL